MSHWPLVPLGEVLKQTERSEAVDPSKTYRLLGVRLDGAGPFLRETLLGTGSAAARLSQVRTGDFIYSRLFAWRGAFGVISNELDGCFVSGEFPTFTPDQSRLDVRFLNYWFKLRSTSDAVAERCSGSTPLTRNRFKEQYFVQLSIPLPPLAEQRRLVERIEALAAKVEAALQLRKEVEDEIGVLRNAYFAHCVAGRFEKRQLRELKAPDSTISYGVLVPGEDEPLGVPFVRIQDLHPTNPAASPSKRIAPRIDEQYKRTRLAGNEVLVAVVGATIGKVGIVPQSWVNANIARAVCRIVPGPQVTREYLIEALRSTDVQEAFRTTTRTLAQPTLNVRQLEQTQIPVPPLSEQVKIVEKTREFELRTERIVSYQRETSAEIAALLPAVLDRAFRGEL